MKRSSTRIAKLETQVAHRSRTERRGNRALDVRLACAMLACEPDLALVAASDTDPETYRDIQEIRAFARRDYLTAERLRAARPKPKPLPPNATEEDIHRRLVEIMDVSDESERKRKAIAAARARLGIKGHRRRAVPMPE